MPTEKSLETDLLGPVLGDRDCGACTMCCTVLTVDTPEFEKPAGRPCVHLALHGCNIHAARPHICRTWFCAWRRIAGMPDDARPDRSGILVSLDFVRDPSNCFEGVSIMVRMHPGSKAIENGMASSILDVLCDRLVPVWFSDGTKKMLMHPEDCVASLVISGGAAPPHLRDEVAAWRERYGVFATKG
ncbi:YkgJ family cysteine cluster protein [Sphingobium boeckii]|nr:YkgJ family cysteine cluster protein [Sphingobium boeckii]